MINVFPQSGLVKAYIFRDSKGERLMLSPAETLADIDTTPQEFDETDSLVAENLLAHIKAKEIKVEKKDRDLLAATMKQAQREAELAQKAEDAKKAAIESETGVSQKDMDKAINAAVKDAEKKFKDFVSPKEHQKSIDKAVADALKNKNPETGQKAG